MMKRFLLLLTLSLIPMVTLNAQTPSQVGSESDGPTSRLAEPGALVLVMAGIGGLVLWSRRHR
jgi:hypothetical protein